VIQLRQLISPGEIQEIRDVFMEQVETDRSLGFDDSLPDDDSLARYPRFVHPHRHPEVEAGRLPASS
jgi:phytanoyl-CoA hydroxylase